MVVGQLYIKNIKKCWPSKTGLGLLIVQSRDPNDPLEFWVDLNAVIYISYEIVEIIIINLYLI